MEVQAYVVMERNRLRVYGPIVGAAIMSDYCRVALIHVTRVLIVSQDNSQSSTSDLKTRLRVMALSVILPLWAKAPSTRCIDVVSATV
jgi:hypothetical protein